MDVPQRLGKYEIRGTLGRGAMGVVYDGFDPLIARRVAIKSVPLPKNPDPDTEEEIARFRREAQAAGRLTHPNIVGVYDYGETDDVAYIVMEHVDGPTLKNLLDKKERFPLDTIGRVMGDLLAGLQFSHERGVVHRDIKPGNIMLTTGGQAKIADFGIARIEMSSMTQAGTMLGTPAYMSPEQFRGEVADARTDVYSAGVLLYQLLTGDRPFEGGLTTIMHKVLNTDPPAPSQLAGTAPASLDAVVRKAMAKRPEDRYASATAFADALRTAIAAPAAKAAPPPDDDEDGATLVRPAARPASPRPAAPPPPTPAPPAAAKSKLPLFAGVGILALLVLGGAGWFFTRSSPSEPVTQVAQVAPAATPPPAAPETKPVPPPVAPPVAPTVADAQPPAPPVQPEPPPATTVKPEPPPVVTATEPPPAPPPVAKPPATAPVVTAPVVTAPVVATTPVATTPVATTPVATKPAEPPPPAPPPVTQPPVSQPSISQPPTTTTAQIQPPAPPPPAKPPAQPATQPTAPPSTTTAAATPVQPATVQPSTKPAEPVATVPAVPVPHLPPPQPPAPAPATARVTATTTAPATPTQTAAAASAILAQIGQAVHGANCTLATAVPQDSGALTIQGVGDGSAVGALRRQVDAIPGAPPTIWLIRTIDPIFCPVLAMLRPVSTLAGIPGPGLSLTLANNRVVLPDGDAILPRLTMPDFSGEVRVDYLSRDGSVAHLYPTLADNSDPAKKLLAQPSRHLAAGEHLALGDPGPGKPEWESGTPYGTDIIIAVASSTPLRVAPAHNADEKSDAYLADLSRAIDQARAAGARVSGALLLVETVPKK